MLKSSIFEKDHFLYFYMHWIIQSHQDSIAHIENYLKDTNISSAQLFALLLRAKNSANISGTEVELNAAAVSVGLNVIALQNNLMPVKNQAVETSLRNFINAKNKHDTNEAANLLILETSEQLKNNTLRGWHRTNQLLEMKNLLARCKLHELTHHQDPINTLIVQIEELEKNNGHAELLIAVTKNQLRENALSGPLRFNRLSELKELLSSQENIQGLNKTEIEFLIREIQLLNSRDTTPKQYNPSLKLQQLKSDLISTEENIEKISSENFYIRYQLMLKRFKLQSDIFNLQAYTFKQSVHLSDVRILLGNLQFPLNIEKACDHLIAYINLNINSITGRDVIEILSYLKSNEMLRPILFNVKFKKSLISFAEQKHLAIKEDIFWKTTLLQLNMWEAVDRQVASMKTSALHEPAAHPNNRLLPQIQQIAVEVCKQLRQLISLSGNPNFHQTEIDQRQLMRQVAEKFDRLGPEAKKLIEKIIPTGLLPTLFSSNPYQTATQTGRVQIISSPDTFAYFWSNYPAYENILKYLDSDPAKVFSSQ